MASPPDPQEQLPASETVELPTPGTPEIRIGHYKVLKKLGQGGMGEVHLAEDPRLDRRVALKMLPAHFTEDRDRVRRFVQEAKAASALNHPNIITIFDIGNADGKHYMATEYIQGQTLRQQMATQVTISMALDVGIQMASALEAAHEAGIIHRDIKPENVMMRPDGLVKILDFGIAKLIEKPSPPPLAHVSADGENAETLQLEMTVEGTAPGMILGTVSYMSPEQLRGEKVDARSDIFSLGVMLYEVIAGTPPFAGQTQADKIAAILEREPRPLVEHRTDVPPELVGIISKAVRKERESRYQDIKDLLADLKELKQELEFKEKLERPGRIEARDRLEPTNARWGRWWKPLKVIRAPVLQRRRVLGISAGGVVIVASLVAAGLYWFSPRAVALTDKDTVVLADFTNTTGDPIFDDTLRQGLASQLEQSPFLSLVPDERIVKTLALMTRPADARLTHQLAREVGERIGSKASIEGSISGLGGPYTLRLKTVHCQSGDLLAEVQESAGNREQVLEAMGKAAAKLREKLGESLASVQKYDVPPENVTTNSLEALRAYSQGHRAQTYSGDYKGAVVFFEQATRLDPNFAMAYARLAVASPWAGTGPSPENARKAYGLRERVSERERFYIESTYENFVTENLEASRKIYETWMQHYPRDDVAPFNLANIYARLGEYEKVLHLKQESLRLEPNNPANYFGMSSAYLSLNRFDEARATIEEAQARNLDSPGFHTSLYYLAFLERDTAGMEREVVYLTNRPGSSTYLLSMQSETLAHGGQMSRARELAKRSVEEYTRAGQKATATSLQAQAALCEALMGNLTLANREAAEAVNLTNSEDPQARYIQAVSATVFALAGDSAKATRMADDLERRFPENTVFNIHYLPMVRVAAAIRSGNSARAIDASAAGERYELGAGTNIILYRVYLRGLAHLAARQSEHAAATFQKILDHPGLVFTKPIGPLAHLGLGRAYALAGDSTKARTAYQDFLALWKDADPDIPILKQARAEYESVKSK